MKLVASASTFGAVTGSLQHCTLRLFALYTSYPALNIHEQHANVYCLKLSTNRHPLDSVYCLRSDYI